MWDWLKSKVVAIGTYKLILYTSHILYPHDTFCPIFESLISLLELDLKGYVFNFGNQSLHLSRNLINMLINLNSFILFFLIL